MTVVIIYGNYLFYVVNAVENKSALIDHFVHGSTYEAERISLFGISQPL